MIWQVEVQDGARKDLRKLGEPTAGRLLRFLRERIATKESPERLGKALTGTLGRYWSYRVGDYRVLCEILHDRRVVRVRKIGHRREVYR